MFMKSSTIVLLALSATCAAQTPAWVHGSWVNVRQSAIAQSAVLAQLPTNTPLSVVSRNEGWCEVTAQTVPRGFIHCSLLGDKPLTLADIMAQAPDGYLSADQTARAFWVAPSVGRFAALGGRLRDPYRRNWQTLKPGEAPSLPTTSEFKAVQRVLQRGIRPEVGNELRRGLPVPIDKLPDAIVLKPTAIKPSLFRLHSDVALVSEGDQDTMAAVSGATITMENTRKPVIFFHPHDGVNSTGFGDLGTIDLRFDPPIPVYAVMDSGRIGAVSIPKRVDFGLWDTGSCAQSDSYGSIQKAFGWPWPVQDDHDRNSTLHFQVDHRPGFAKIDAPALAAFVTTKPVSPGKANVLHRSAKIAVNPDDYRSLKYLGKQELERSFRSGEARTLWEIDLDRDRIPDILVYRWERPGSTEMETILRWYVNVNGQWYSAGEYTGSSGMYCD